MIASPVMEEGIPPAALELLLDRLVRAGWLEYWSIDVEGTGGMLLGWSPTTESGREPEESIQKFADLLLELWTDGPLTPQEQNALLCLFHQDPQ